MTRQSRLQMSRPFRQPRSSSQHRQGSARKSQGLAGTPPPRSAHLRSASPPVVGTTRRSRPPSHPSSGQRQKQRRPGLVSPPAWGTRHRYRRRSPQASGQEQPRLGPVSRPVWGTTHRCHPSRPPAGQGQLCLGPVWQEGSGGPSSAWGSPCRSPRSTSCCYLRLRPRWRWQLWPEALCAEALAVSARSRRSRTKSHCRP
mmetsp:Transcript_118196/g.346237  ORF Transcript_118196/g.346237 Transcript_118196/m.346237 type:complete len:200 (-) Transcript_118196:88-687(-)